jgi:hypothetical protein
VAIQEAAERNDYDRIENLNGSARRIVSMEREIRHEHSRMECCDQGRRDGHGRSFETVIEGGAVKNHYLSVKAGVAAK